MRGIYTNWFMPSFWDPTHVAMKMYKNYTAPLMYLQSKYKLQGHIGSVYDDLTRGTLFNWFTTSKILKERVGRKI